MIVPDLPAKDMNEWLQNGLTLPILEKHLSNAKPWLDILIDHSRTLSPLELDENLQAITRHITNLPDTLRSRYVSQIEKKLSIPKRDLKSLMNQREEENGYLDSEIRERPAAFQGRSSWKLLGTHQS